MQNAAGRAGAYFADILFMVLGYFAYIFPLLLAVKTWQIFRQRHQPWDWSGWLFSWRLIGLVFLVLSGRRWRISTSIRLRACHFLPAAPGREPWRPGAQPAERAGQYADVHCPVPVRPDRVHRPVMVQGDGPDGKITLDLFELVQGAANRWWEARNERKRLEAQLREDEPVVKAAPTVAENANPPNLRCVSASSSAKRRRRRWSSPRADPRARARCPVREPALAREPVVPPASKPCPCAVVHANHRAPAVDKAPEPSKRVMKEADAAVHRQRRGGTLPSISILDPAEQKKIEYSPESLAGVGQLLEIKLKEFGVEVSVDSIHPGPVITRYEIQPAAGVKVSRIANLARTWRGRWR